MSSFGYGQTWQVVTGSRAYSTTYYNTTGKAIFVFVQNTSAATATATVNGVVIHNTSGTNAGFINFIVPPGGSYSTAWTAGSLNLWTELR
jgi:hypothetical protein